MLKVVWEEFRTVRYRNYEAVDADDFATINFTNSTRAPMWIPQLPPRHIYRYVRVYRDIGGSHAQSHCSNKPVSENSSTLPKEQV